MKYLFILLIVILSTSANAQSVDSTGKCKNSTSVGTYIRMKNGQPRCSWCGGTPGIITKRKRHKFLFFR